MPIYSRVEDIKDISRINCIIRDEMLEVEDVSQLSELKKRSDYLCTLTFSPFWKKKFKDNIKELQEAAILENRVTVKEANIVSKYKNFNKEYSPWKKEIDVEKELEKIPQSVIEEITQSAFTLKLDAKILEKIREIFCDSRKAIVLCEDEKCVKELKRGVDIVSLLPYLDSFAEHFEESLQKEIDELILKEKNRTIKLIDIIFQINGWEEYFEDNIDEDNIKEHLEKLLEDEEKSDTYIPTEVKYKGNAKVLWVVYYHPKRKRDYAKRVYFPAEFKDLKVEGPGEFTNKFGNKVWGIEFIYKSKVEKTVIKVRGKKIKLPTRWVTRKKIVTLPKEARAIRVLPQKPKSAMDIA